VRGSSRSGAPPPGENCSGLIISPSSDQQNVPETGTFFCVPSMNGSLEVLLSGLMAVQGLGPSGMRLGDPQLLLGDQCHVFGRLGPCNHQFRSHPQALACSTSSASFSASMSSGSALRSTSMQQENHKFCDLWRTKMHAGRYFIAHPALLGRQVSCGFRQSIPSSM
jgi:hypothetical protein